eukprot:5157975-Pyramimonas_sp.AAC.1
MSCPGASWSALGGLLGSSWGALGSSWGPPGVVSFGSFESPLGAILRRCRFGVSSRADLLR